MTAGNGPGLEDIQCYNNTSKDSPLGIISFKEKSIINITLSADNAEEIDKSQLLQDLK